MDIEEVGLQGEEATGVIKAVLTDKAKEHTFKSKFRNRDGTERPDYVKVRVPLLIDINGSETDSISIFLPQAGGISPNSVTGRIMKAIGAKTVKDLVGKTVRLRKQGNFWRLDY